MAFGHSGLSCLCFLFCFVTPPSFSKAFFLEELCFALGLLFSNQVTLTQGPVVYYRTESMNDPLCFQHFYISNSLGPEVSRISSTHAEHPVDLFSLEYSVVEFSDIFLSCFSLLFMYFPGWFVFGGHKSILNFPVWVFNFVSLSVFHLCLWPYFVGSFFSYFFPPDTTTKFLMNTVKLLRELFSDMLTCI